MRTGFTLLEVLVAVMITATLLLSADVVFEQMASSREGSARAAAERDRTRNAMTLIGGLVRQVDVSPQAGVTSAPHSFGGDAVQSSFSSWCIAPGNWERECDVTLRAVVDSTGAELIASSSAGDSARLRMQGPSVALRYLVDANDGGHWLNSWPFGPTVPVAIGIMTPVDTIIFRVGARG